MTNSDSELIYNTLFHYRLTSMTLSLTTNYIYKSKIYSFIQQNAGLISWGKKKKEKESEHSLLHEYDEQEELRKVSRDEEHGWPSLSSKPS